MDSQTIECLLLLLNSFAPDQIWQKKCVDFAYRIKFNAQTVFQRISTRSSFPNTPVEQLFATRTTFLTLNMFSRIASALFYAFFAFALLAAATEHPVTTTVTVTAVGLTCRLR
jgi:hypothetical protein